MAAKDVEIGDTTKVPLKWIISGIAAALSLGWGAHAFWTTKTDADRDEVMRKLTEVQVALQSIDRRFYLLELSTRDSWTGQDMVELTLRNERAINKTLKEAGLNVSVDLHDPREIRPRSE